MKKLFFPLFLVFLLAMSSIGVNALLPVIVYGEVRFEGEPYVSQLVTITDLDLGASLEARTNGNGVYQFDLANLKDSIGRGVDPGDRIQVSVCPVELNEDCRQTVILPNNPLKLDFDIGDAGLADGTAKDEYVPPPPPVVEADCTEEAVLVEGLLVERDTLQTKLDSCEEARTDSGWALGLILGIVGIGVGSGATYWIKKDQSVVKGVGLKQIFDKDGKRKIYHRHHGIRAYHDPYTQHRDVWERHKRGELTPEYVKNPETGRYETKEYYERKGGVV